MPDPERNREFWRFVLWQALIAVGASLHYTALPGLIAPRKEDAGQLGLNRSLNWGSQAASNLVTGPLVDRLSARNVLVWTHVARGALLAAASGLFFSLSGAAVALPVLGLVPAFIVAFQAITALHGFLQATSMTAGSVAFNRILGPDRAHYDRANAVYNVVVSVAGVIGPLLAGALIVAFGYALAYAGYGAILVAAGLGFTTLRVPGDAAPKVRGEPRRGRLKELGEGFRLVWSSRFLRLTTLLSSLYLLAADSLVFTALPRYLKDVLGPSLPAWAAAGGAFGLYLSVASAGLVLSALAAAFWRGRARPVLRAGSLDAQDRAGRLTGIVSGLGFLLYWAVFFSPGLWASLGAMFAVTLLQGAALVVWAGLYQDVIRTHAPRDMGKVYAALGFYQLVLSIAGILGFSWLMAELPTVSALWIVGGVMTAVAVSQVAQALLVFPSKPR